MGDVFRPMGYNLPPAAKADWLKDLNEANRKHGVMSTASIAYTCHQNSTTGDFQQWSMAEIKALRTGAQTLQALQAAAAASRPVRKANSESRNIRLAEKFLQRRKAGSGKSDSALMEAIGAAEELSRSAAIAAIKRGLKLLNRE
jgi:hypothetical protein